MQDAEMTARPRPSEPRVEPVPHIAERARERSVGRPIAPINLTATLAHCMPVSKGIGAISDVFFDPGVVEPRLREIVILRTGWNTRSLYEFGQHVMAGRTVGLTEDEIKMTTMAITDGPWSDLEAAALQMVDDLCADDCVTDATWEGLTANADTQTTIALVALCGLYRMVAGVLNSLGIQPEPDLPRWP